MHSFSIDNILECVSYIYIKYAWVVPFKNKKVITITNTFHKISNERKKIWLRTKKIWQIKTKNMVDKNFTKNQ